MQLANTRFHRAIYRIADPPGLLLGGLSLLAIILGVSFRVSGHLPATNWGTPVDYISTTPIFHGLLLAMVAILAGSLIYQYGMANGLGVTKLLIGALIATVINSLVLFPLGGSIQPGFESGFFTARPVVTVAAVTLGALFTLALRTRYDWIAINFAGLLLVPVAIGMFATRSLTFLAGVLVITAIVDYLLVHRSTIMETMATSFISSRIPVAFIIPITTPTLSDAVAQDDGDILIEGIRLLGFGDSVIPGAFVAAVALQHATLFAVPVATALLGYALAYLLLNANLFDKHAYAGLPFLNAGVLLGYGIGVLL